MKIDQVKKQIDKILSSQERKGKGDADIRTKGERNS
jgi:hypothetical protein